MKASYQIYTLPNGARLVHQHCESKVAHIALFVNAGSRNESEQESGLAHLIEHLIFKGTTKRKSIQIINRMESVGGDINAYTSKEETCIYSTFTTEYYYRAMELLADIYCNASFPEKELLKEKNVVLEEIRTYKDSPDEQIIDEFENIIFAGHPLGKYILGTKKTVNSISHKNILAFKEKYYNAQNIVLCSTGNISFKKAIAYFNSLFSSLQSGTNNIPENTNPIYIPFKKTVAKKNYQAHCIIGNIAYDAHNELRFPLALLSNYLGGPGMNTLLNLGIREKYGLTYTIESSFQTYSDAGVFAIYFGVEHPSLEKCVGLVYNELRKLRENKISTLKLHQAKKQFCGQLIIANESKVNELMAVGKNMLVKNKPFLLEETIEKIENINAEELQNIANEIFNSDSLSTYIYD